MLKGHPKLRVIQMSFREWIEYLLERFLWYLETPRAERKELKRQHREPWGYRWFGLIPFSVKMAWNQHKARLRGKMK